MNIKTWLIEVAVKKMGPSAIRGAILGAFAWLLTKEGVLASFGIMMDQASHTITIHLDKLNGALDLLIPAALAAIIKLMNHQATELVAPKSNATTLPPSQ